MRYKLFNIRSDVDKSRVQGTFLFSIVHCFESWSTSFLFTKLLHQCIEEDKVLEKSNCQIVQSGSFKLKNNAT